MRLIRTIYEDSTGRLWEVEFTRIPDPASRVGSREVWRIQSGRHVFTGPSKRELFRLAQATVDESKTPA